MLERTSDISRNFEECRSGWLLARKASPSFSRRAIRSGGPITDRMLNLHRTFEQADKQLADRTEIAAQSLLGRAVKPPAHSPRVRTNRPDIQAADARLSDRAEQTSQALAIKAEEMAASRRTAP